MDDAQAKRASQRIGEINRSVKQLDQKISQLGRGGKTAYERQQEEIEKAHAALEMCRHSLSVIRGQSNEFVCELAHITSFFRRPVDSHLVEIARKKARERGPMDGTNSSYYNSEVQRYIDETNTKILMLKSKMAQSKPKHDAKTSEIAALTRQRSDLIAERERLETGVQRHFEEQSRRTSEMIAENQRAAQQRREAFQLQELNAKVRIEEIRLEVERLKQQGDERDREEIYDLMNQLKDML